MKRIFPVCALALWSALNSQAALAIAQQQPPLSANPPVVAPPPVYVRPRPVYVEQPYYAPPRVVYRPAPVYYGPPGHWHKKPRKHRRHRGWDE